MLILYLVLGRVAQAAWPILSHCIACACGTLDVTGPAGPLSSPSRTPCIINTALLTAAMTSAHDAAKSCC